MQFVAHGPEIPDVLLQAHEEGRVVFFCGAGISYPAGLPGFKGLVDDIYRLNNTTLNDIEQEAYSRGQYDATLDLLGQRLPGQRLAVRSVLMSALKPNYRRKGATDTHAALLQLACSHSGTLRLVTTNFDRIFHRLTTRSKTVIAAYPAPLLPIPKNSRWNGLVYLHGLLPEQFEESALNRLVLTSGDFGLAYLTERWASRFVSELFRNYVVCFVGYSINDPVLRYMMDALAADRMLGEITPQAYALGDCSAGQEVAKTLEWEAKGVKPILYEVPLGTHDHSALHHTLKAWADTYRDGILGKERIVVDYAITRPAASTKQDDFVSRMNWALKHESGLPAKRFAEFDPVPSLDWLDTFAFDRYHHGDLARFGVPPLVEVDGKLSFSLIHRPSTYSHSQWMSLVSHGAVDSRWDDVMYHMARWLVRHLNDPVLILWLVKYGGQLHEQLVRLIEAELEKISKLQLEKKTAELARISANSPNAIPQPVMITLWNLLLSGRVKSSWRNFDIYRWKAQLKRNGLTATLRVELRKFLAPKITLRKPLHSWGGDVDNGENKRLRQLIDWELELATDHVHSAVNDLNDSSFWHAALPAMVDDFKQLLSDALDLLRELGEADFRSDNSHWDLPSISSHRQNKGFRDWVVLIELLRDAWLVVREIDPTRASLIAQDWFTLPYPTFKRLAFFAASHSGCIVASQWVGWLLSEDGWWLWSVETRRELLRLLVLQGSHLASGDRSRLEAAILSGPIRSMYRDEIEPPEWEQVADYSVWLRLSKLEVSGIVLGTEVARRLSELSAKNPDWKIAQNESDEFSHWTTSTGDPDYEDRSEVSLAPRNRLDLVKWLQRPASPRYFFYKDNWSEICCERFFHCAYALCDLAKEDQWPADPWRKALQAWSKEGQLLRSWRYVSPLIINIPDGILLEIAQSVTWWLETVSKVIDQNDMLFLKISSRLLNLAYQDNEDKNRSISQALNHPIGHVTQAVLHFWLKREPNDHDGLPEGIKSFFSRLCFTQVEQFRHGRVLLAANLIALFRVDYSWTEAHLLPLFNWKSHPVDARDVWEGFLWSPRLYFPLLNALKIQFLETARHYAELGEYGRQYAAFLTYVALDAADGYTKPELKAALESLPQEGLNDSAQALAQALEGAGEQNEQFWINRILPFWQAIWPKSRQLATKLLSEKLARLVIAAGGEFPVALQTIIDWLKPLEHPDYLIQNLENANLCTRFPRESLLLLYTIVDNHSSIHNSLGKCLEVICLAWPEAGQDNRYKQLMEHHRKRS